MGLIGNLNLRFFRTEEEDKSRNFYDSQIIMTEDITKIDIAQIVVTEEISIVDKIEVDRGMNKIIGEEILEAM